MEVEIIVMGPIETNCYLLREPGEGRVVVVDPGMEPEKIENGLKEAEIEAILLTHAHFDHMGGVETVRQWTDAPVYLHDAEKDWMGDAEFNRSGVNPELCPEPVTAAPAEQLLDGGEQLTVLDRPCEVIHLPGHSPGGVGYYFPSEGWIFSGDALFSGSIGRTDLPGGSYDSLMQSIRTGLLSLPDATHVFPGHGPRTTLLDEKRLNPFLQTGAR